MADDLLRVFANRRQPGILRRLGIAGQAQDQCIERSLRGLLTLLWRLAVDRFAHLIEAFDGFSMAYQAGQANQ
ncbi:hypothetical protein D3C76_1424810 [compost metagenome]